MEEFKLPCKKGGFMAKQANSLARTKWMCKYHIVFTPKYRRKIIYNQYRESLGKILRQLCEYKGVEIHEGFGIGSCTHAGQYSPKNQYIQFYGILKWEKCADDV